MADQYELVLAVDLDDDLTAAEVAELRWHLGLGRPPARPGIVTGFPSVGQGDDGELIVTDDPRPLLGQRGPGWKIAGMLSSGLARRDNPAGWMLTCRQEIHPDSFDEVRAVLDWLADRAGRGHGDEFAIGHVRFYEDVDPVPLTVSSGTLRWPL